MRGAALLIWVLCLVAARASPLGGTSADDKHTLLDDEYTYPVVSLDLQDELTLDNYTNFIVAIRDRLRNPADVRFPVPVLPSRTNVQISERFVLVDLSNLARETVTLALDVIDAQVVGYRAGRYAVFLRPDNDEIDAATSHLFREVTARRALRFAGSYTHLEAIQHGVNRFTVDLGADALNKAVSAMYHYAQRPNDRLGSLASAFLVTIQMVSEAARFRYIEDEVLIRIREHRNYPADVRVIGLENNWSRLSYEIQNSYQGIFNHQVEIQTLDGPFHVDDMLLAMRLIGLILFTCNPRRPQGSLHLSPLISSKSDHPAAICHEDQEPTVQIAGPGELCADVRDHKYNDGNPIQLYPCRSSDNVNQLWTFKRDGTIRSNGKCLGLSGHTPGDYIVIHDCRYASNDKFKWDVWGNGTIISRSGLVLAARSLESGTLLTAEVDTYTIGQSWLPSNYTEPLVTPIVGISSGLCFGADLLLETCVPRKADQAWALYRDGSIRPNQRRLDSCLTLHTEASSSPSLKIALCEAASSLQRWVYPNDGTIMNLETKLVMDITPGSIPSIIMAYHTGDLSQIWRL